MPISAILYTVSSILRCPLGPGQMSITHFSVSIPERHASGGTNILFIWSSVSGRQGGTTIVGLFLFGGGDCPMVK